MPVGRGYSLSTVEEAIKADRALPQTDSDAHEEVQSRSPSIEIDFDPLLIEQKRLSQTRVFQRFESIEVYSFFQENPEVSDQLIPVLVERLQEETKFMDELVQFTYLQDLSTTGDDKRTASRHGIGTIKWRQRRGFYEGSSGRFNRLTKNLGITGDKPTSYELLVSLASKGKLPYEASILIHELTHTFQDQNGFPKIGLEGYEADAFRQMHLLNGMIHSRIALAQTIEDSYPDTYSSVLSFLSSQLSRTESLRPLHEYANRLATERENIRIEKIVGAIEGVDKLLAMGLPHRAVSRIVMNAEEYENGSFPELDVAIKLRMDELGINDADLALLVLAYQIEVRIDMLRVRMITKEEMKRVWEEQHKEKHPLGGEY